MIIIEQLNEQEYSISQDEHELGIIKIYSNPFHNQNCYLQLNLVNYDLSISNKLFIELMKKIQRPMQVMIESVETNKIAFLEKGGFVCKRKCYEIEVQREDYAGDNISSETIQWCEIGSIEYEKSCELLYAHYAQVHERISPLTVEFQTFSKMLPAKAIYEQIDNEVINAVFVEKNEVAYVCTKDKDRFLTFINTVIAQLFIENQSLIFECDDCDWAAMKLMSLFDVEITESYNTYILDYWCDELQEKHAYINNPCGTYSIPYWKQMHIQIQENMKIMHDREFEEGLLLVYNDEKYFRLSHDLKDIPQVTSDEYRIETATVDDIPLVQELINRSYQDLSVSCEQLLSYTKSEVYDEKLWIIVSEKLTNKPVACGIAELDKELKEGVLEWIQVLPEYRGKKLGQLLVNELLTRLQGKADFVTVSGKVDNATKPERLYRKCGFTGKDIWHVLTKKGN